MARMGVADPCPRARPCRPARASCVGPPGPSHPPRAKHAAAKSTSPMHWPAARACWRTPWQARPGGRIPMGAHPYEMLRISPGRTHPGHCVPLLGTGRLAAPAQAGKQVGAKEGAVPVARSTAGASACAGGDVRWPARCASGRACPGVTVGRGGRMRLAPPSSCGSGRGRTRAAHTQAQDRPSRRRTSTRQRQGYTQLGRGAPRPLLHARTVPASGRRDKSRHRTLWGPREGSGASVAPRRGDGACD